MIRRGGNVVFWPFLSGGAVGGSSSSGVMSSSLSVLLQATRQRSSDSNNQVGNKGSAAQTMDWKIRRGEGPTVSGMQSHVDGARRGGGRGRGRGRGKFRSGISTRELERSFTSVVSDVRSSSASGAGGVIPIHSQNSSRRQGGSEAGGGEDAVENLRNEPATKVLGLEGSTLDGGNNRGGGRGGSSLQSRAARFANLNEVRPMKGSGELEEEEELPSQVLHMIRNRLEELKGKRIDSLDGKVPEATLEAMEETGAQSPTSPELPLEHKLARSGATGGPLSTILPQRLRFQNQERARRTTMLEGEEEEGNNKVADEEEENYSATLDQQRAELDANLLGDSVAMSLSAESSQRGLSSSNGRDNRMKPMQSGFGTDVLKDNTDPAEGVPLCRAVTRAGCCSRRASVLAIAGGKIRVDGLVETDPFRHVSAANTIDVAGHRQRLRFQAPRLWLCHKPSQIQINIAHQEHPEVNTLRLFTDLLGLDHVISIDKLPFRMHGAMLLTNDGDLAKFLAHPSAEIQSTYTFRVKPAIDPVLAYKLNTEGVRIDGQLYKQYEFHTYRFKGSKYIVKIKVRGKVPFKIDQVLQSLGRTVQRGGRTSMGPYALGRLAPGGAKEVPIPPYYMKACNEVWRPFIERDWPYFRRLRVQRLRTMANFRQLTEAERGELDSFTYDQISQVLTHEKNSLQEESDAMTKLYSSPPDISGVKLNPGMPAAGSRGSGTGGDMQGGQFDDSVDSFDGSKLSFHGQGMRYEGEEERASSDDDDDYEVIASGASDQDREAEIGGGGSSAAEPAFDIFNSAAGLPGAAGQSAVDRRHKKLVDHFKKPQGLSAVDADIQMGLGVPKFDGLTTL